jgi:uncharacterized protein YrrD
MAHYGTLRETRFSDVEDIRGSEVYGVNDEKLGKIDDVIFNHSSGDIRYVVVDTGGWLTSKKFLVPVNRISPYGHHDDKYYAELDKERIQMLPEYDEKHLKSESGWTDYEERYDKGWKHGEVMYNERTGRIITPPAEETLAGAGRPSAGTQVNPANLTPERRGQQDDLLGVASSGDNVTLRPKKPSIAGREDVVRPSRERNVAGGTRDVQRAENLETGEREVMTPMGNDFQYQGERSRATNAENVRQSEIDTARDRSVEGVSQSGLEGSRVPETEGLREPGVYKLDAVPEAERENDLNAPLNANYGPRWTNFQQRLRSGRDKVVAECELCGSQRKVA